MVIVSDVGFCCKLQGPLFKFEERGCGSIGDIVRVGDIRVEMENSHAGLTQRNVFGVIVCVFFLIALLCCRDGWFFRQDHDATFLRQKQTHFSVFTLRSLRPRQNLRQSTIGWLGECECECIVVEC